MVLPTPASSMMLQRDSGLLAVVCDDMVVRIIDIETRRVVRELACGVHGRILDIVGCGHYVGFQNFAEAVTGIFVRFSLDSGHIVGLCDTDIRYTYWSANKCVPHT